MIIFIIYIFLLIYVFEFYNYIIKLKTQFAKKSSTTNTLIEKFEIDPHCEILPANYIDSSENVLEPIIQSYDSLSKISKQYAPLPADDTRAYYNKDFEILLNHTLPERPYRNTRWHCLRDYMTCGSAVNYLPALKQPVDNPSKIVKNYRNQKQKN